MKEFTKFVGLDTHKETIAVAVSEARGEAVRYYGAIPNEPKAIAKLVKTLAANGAMVSFCYEAGPCGYGLYRHLTELGQACVVVVAPSLIPTKPGISSGGLNRPRRPSKPLPEKRKNDCVGGISICWPRANSPCKTARPWRANWSGLSGPLRVRSDRPRL